MSERLGEAQRRAGNDAGLAARALRLAEAFDSVDLKNRTAAESETSAPARRFGPYTAIRLLGSGGMGSVFLAERTDGQFKQLVAVKVLSAHLAGPRFEQRFLEERQMVAGLNHPFIARLLDGNVSEHGDPYLVLEYVDGMPLDRFCDSERLSIAARLDLFLKVCAAVEFAHRNLIVHRDLKPSNILVKSDGDPKLLDFGAARLMAHPSETNTMAFMTPRYASPEQLRSQRITTATDVYSLGILLYELLTGAWPFGDPSDPNLALMRATGNVAMRDPAEVAPVLRGDLATILRKALEIEPERRYSSVREFADDIERYRSGRPILARPLTLSYRARKFVRRNRFGVAAAVAVCVALAGGMAATAWQARVAHLARQSAVRRFEEVRQLANFLTFDIYGALQQLPGSTPLQRRIVERSQQYLDGLLRESSADMGLRLEVAEGYQKLGDILGNPYRPSLGERKLALETYDKAMQATDSVLKQDPRNVTAARLAASLRLRQGAAQAFGGDQQGGLAKIQRAVDDLKVLAGKTPDDVETLLALAAGLEVTATRLRSAGGEIDASNAARVIDLYGQSRVYLENALRSHAGHPLVLKQLSLVETGEGLLWGSSDPGKAIARYQKAVQWLDGLPATEQDNLDVRRMRITSLLNTGWAQGQIGRYREALANVDEAGKLMQVWAAVDPANASVQYQLSGMYRTRGIIHGYNRDPAKAIVDFQAAADIHRGLMVKDPGNAVYRFLLAELLSRMGNLYESTGQHAAAVKNASEGLSRLSELAAAPGATLSHLLGACRWLLETEVRSLRNPAAAERFCLRGAEKSNGQDPDAFEGLANARDQMGDRAGAIAAAEKAIALLPPGAESRQRQTMEGMLARLRRGQR